MKALVLLQDLQRLSAHPEFGAGAGDLGDLVRVVAEPAQAVQGHADDVDGLARGRLTVSRGEMVFEFRELFLGRTPEMGERLRPDFVVCLVPGVPDVLERPQIVHHRATVLVGAGTSKCLDVVQDDPVPAGAEQARLAEFAQFDGHGVARRADMRGQVLLGERRFDDAALFGCGVRWPALPENRLVRGKWTGVPMASKMVR